MRGLRLGLWLTGVVMFAGVPGASAAPFAYIANDLSNDVSVLDIATNSVVATVPVGQLAQGVAVTPDGSRVYVTNTADNTVSVIATATNTVVATVPVGDRPIGVVVTPKRSRVYVANINSSTVSVINPSTNLAVAALPVGLVAQSAAVGLHPQGLAVTHDGKSVYVANTNANTMSVIATATNTVVATVPAGNGPVAFGNFIGP